MRNVVSLADDDADAPGDTPMAASTLFDDTAYSNDVEEEGTEELWADNDYAANLGCNDAVDRRPASPSPQTQRAGPADGLPWTQ